MQVKTVKEKDMPKRAFAFTQEFPNEVTLALKAYDSLFKELTTISNGKIDFPDEYGVCNNLYKFRYITPSDIATFVSNMIKAIRAGMIHPHVNDLEKFAVVSARQFVEDHGCVPIEHSSIYGLYNYTTDQMTLKDLLILCENDFYHKTVVSKYEMHERVKVMKEDYKKIADMHFSTNVQKVVSSLPGLMTQTEYNNMNYMEQKAVQTFIEEFILFTIMFNTVIMSNMIFFCVPKSTYSTKEIQKKQVVDTNNLMDDDDVETMDDDVVTEAVKLGKDVKPVYIVLTEGTEWVSQQVKKHTMSRYSHSGIAFDSSLHKVYSFGMSNPQNEDTKTKDGFRMDDMFNDHHKGIRFSVFVTFVSIEAFDKMKEYADKVKNSPKTTYSLGMIWHQLWNDDKPRKDNDKNAGKEVCSTFVNSILKAANIDLTKKNRPSPGDFEAAMLTNMRQFEHLFTGTSAQYDRDYIEERVKDFANRKDTEKLKKSEDVVTECCLLKTNTMRCHSKIPFDINMRNIVLQDMHPRFKDTIAAIDYITKDTRSPIAQMLYRYAHPSEVLNGMDGCMILRMFMNCPCYECCSYDEYANKLHEIDFHTDVNWLDKIAYGNNFIDGNYRDDAMGNEHRHPIKQTLDTLYRMFGECKLKTKEELCDHILKVSHIMRSIAQMYGSIGIYNWEMVRDILAVLGEIMTRSMIKLYDSQMTIIASDNMDDVDAPGYMYTESFKEFEIDDFDSFVMEAADDSKEKPEKASVSSSGKASTLGEHVKKIIEWIKKMINKFIAWVQNTLSKLGITFAKNHKQEIEYVRKNSALNAQIGDAIKSGDFKPAIVGWPKFKLQVKNITKKKMSDIIKEYLDDVKKQTPTTYDLKKMYYPDEVIDKLSGDKSTTPPKKKPESEQQSEGESGKKEDSSIAEYYLSKRDVVDNRIKRNRVVMEAFDTTNMHPIFVILGNHSIIDGHLSNVTKGIMVATGTSVSHCVISLDPSLELCYSITPISTPKETATGLVTKNDNIVKRPTNAPQELEITAQAGPNYDKKLDSDYHGSDDDEHREDRDILVYGAWVSEEAYNKLNDFLSNARSNAKNIKYSWAEIAKSFFKTDKKLDSKNAPKDVRNSYVCSSIVIAALHQAGVKITNRSSDSPGGLNEGMLLSPDRWIKIYQGKSSMYRKQVAMSSLKEFATLDNSKSAENMMTPDEIKAKEVSDKQNMSANAKLLSNYFLYGDTEAPDTAKELTKDLWDDLIDNLTNADKALEIVAKSTAQDLNKAVGMLKERVESIQSRMKNATRDVEGGSDFMNQTMGGSLPNNSAILESEWNTMDLAKYQSLLKSVMEISNEYTVGFANALQRKFYLVSYNLYRDTVTVFKGQYHTKEAKQPSVSKEPIKKDKPVTKEPVSKEPVSKAPVLAGL